jgi:head-tail adaptor
MTRKADFNAEEWSVVVGAPLLASMMVIAADKGGSVRETVAVARAYAEAKQSYEGELMSALLAEAAGRQVSSRSRSREDVAAEALAGLRQAISILERVATEDEVIEYKRFVYALGETAAQAHKEGGFLGIGGTPVSAKEQAALDEIAAIFDE